MLPKYEKEANRGLRFALSHSRFYRSLGLAVAAFLLVFLLLWGTHSTSVHAVQEIGKSAIATIKHSTGGSRPEAWRPHSSHIPPKVWQIMLPKDPANTKGIFDPKDLSQTASWVALNPDYEYTLLGQKGATKFLRQHFRDNPKVLETFNNLPNVGMKSDFLRYLVLLIEGGVYTDTDTEAIKPIDDWVPPEYRGRARAVIGIEWDRQFDGQFPDVPHWLQFAQWTIAAAPGHPIFRSMLDRMLSSAADVAQRHGQPLGQVKPSAMDVYNTTGPAAWTDVVFAHLQTVEPGLRDTKDLTQLKEPRLIGDVLILTIDGFGMGQAHSLSTHDGTIPEAALIRHHFTGNWRSG